MTTPNTTGGALAGIRVLDLGRVVAAPYAAQLLGDLGAEVIKVERPKVGDDVRAYASKAHITSWNRNKRSITLDLSKPEGQEVVRKLAAKADVLIENYIPGTLKRYNLDYATLSQLNPALIYCSISGFGHSGPYSERGGMDHIFQARSGLMSQFAVPGPAGDQPIVTGLVVTDCTTGRDASCAILAALFERTRSGKGQHIDIALMDSAIALMSHAAQEFLLTGVPPTVDASKLTKTGWSGFLDCADGKVFALATRNPWFQVMCDVLGIPDAPKDPRFSTSLARYDNREAISAMIAPLAKKWKKADLAEAFAAREMPAGPVNNAEEAFDDIQVKARGMAINVPSAERPDLRLIRSPLNLSRTPPTYRRPPPKLGEHTKEVLEEIGYDAAGIEKLRASGVI